MTAKPLICGELCVLAGVAHLSQLFGAPNAPEAPAYTSALLGAYNA